MSSEIDRDKIMALCSTVWPKGWLGQPHDPVEGCLKFLRQAYREFGVYIEGTGTALLRDGRKFQKVHGPSFGATAIFGNVAQFGEYKHHVGLMLDDRWCIQSSAATCGVGKIEITRHPFNISIRGFYKPLCFL